MIFKSLGLSIFTFSTLLLAESYNAIISYSEDRYIVPGKKLGDQLILSETSFTWNITTDAKTGESSINYLSSDKQQIGIYVDDKILITQLGDGEECKLEHQNDQNNDMINLGEVFVGQ